jgi:hypothetical protein
MTEAEAYAVLDWDLRSRGFDSPFKSNGDDWRALVCDTCPMHGTARVGVMGECLNCHKPMRIINAKVEITKL